MNRRGNRLAMRPALVSDCRGAEAHGGRHSLARTAHSAEVQILAAARIPAAPELMLTLESAGPARSGSRVVTDFTGRTSDVNVPDGE